MLYLLVWPVLNCAIAPPPDPSITTKARIATATFSGCLQDLVGYVLHSALLVPYFSWQRSHAVHHMRTNHLTEGETHVPGVKDTSKDTFNEKLLATLGENGFTVTQLLFHLVFGWPVYLLTGATGGPVRGKTNHFWPQKPFSDKLFPSQTLKRKVRQGKTRGDIVVVVIISSNDAGNWTPPSRIGAGVAFGRWSWCDAGSPLLVGNETGLYSSRGALLWAVHCRQRLAGAVYLATAYRYGCSTPR